MKRRRSADAGLSGRPVLFTLYPFISVVTEKSQDEEKSKNSFIVVQNSYAVQEQRLVRLSQCWLRKCSLRLTKMLSPVLSMHAGQLLLVFLPHQDVPSEG